MDSEMSMAFRELYSIVVAAVLWSKYWIKKRIDFHCDNESTVHIINKGRSKVQDIRVSSEDRLSLGHLLPVLLSGTSENQIEKVHRL
jgi:hypothetical protein